MNFEKIEISSNQIESESESYIKTHVAWGNGLINWYCLIRRSLNIALKIENEMMEVSVSGFFSSSRRFDYQTRLYNGSSRSFISS